MAAPGGRTTAALSAKGADAAPAAVVRADRAAPVWPANSIAARLFTEGFAFDFFQAVRLLQRLDPERAPVGQATTLEVEAVRFRTLASLTFPPSAIYDLQLPADLAQPLMTVTFFGLTGPSGVLPRHYTELLMRIQRESKAPEKFALRDWLDMFNHRLIAHFFRAWAKYRFWMAYERGDPLRDEPDTFTTALLSLVGMGTPALRNRLQIAWRPTDEVRPAPRVLAQANDLVLIYFSGLLAHRPRCAVGLKQLVAEYTGLPTEVRQFQGQWLLIEPDKQSRLGMRDGNAELGTNFVVGERVFDAQSKIRIRLGPLPFERFQEYLPDRTPFPECKAIFELIHMVRLYIGPEFDFDIQLVLAAETVPETQLPEGTADGPQLGWNSWLRTMTFAVDATDAVFPGEEVVWVNP
jgi:type VI secretion system protein ImpH